MPATWSRVAIIQHLFKLLMGEGSPENEINPASIQGVIQDEVVFLHGDGYGGDRHGIDLAEIFVFGDK